MKMVSKIAITVMLALVRPCSLPQSSTQPLLAGIEDPHAIPPQAIDANIGDKAEARARRK